MPCAAHTNSLKTCQQGDKPCQRAICNADMHRVPAPEEAPVISTTEAMGWTGWAATILAVGIILLFAFMNLPILAKLL